MVVGLSCSVGVVCVTTVHLIEIYNTHLQAELQLDTTERRKWVVVEYSTSSDVFAEEDNESTENDLIAAKRQEYKQITGLSDADITDILGLMYKGHTRKDWLYKLGWLENVTHNRIAHPHMYCFAFLCCVANMNA